MRDFRVPVFLLILLAALGRGELSPAQTLPVGDPMELYLRLMSDTARTQIPSFNLRPVSEDYFRSEITPSHEHPWQHHSFFQRDEVVLPSPEPMVFTETRLDTLLHIHRVVAGETLYAISRQYEVTVEQIMQWNELEGTLLSIGQELIIRQTVETEIPVKPPAPPAPPSRETGLNRFIEDLDFPGRLDLYTPVLFTTYNHTLAAGQNDGALWQGRGLNTSFSIGGLVSYGPLKASIRPEFIYSQNREFELTPWPQPEGISEYGYSLSVIDYPQRFGEDPVSRIAPGQSWIRAEYRDFTAGLSTENLWVGPALHNPVVMSNNAPGFFHVFTGTHRPVVTRIGRVEGKLLWGRLKESDYFDEDDSNNLSFINALIVSYSPKYVPGLHLGFSRVFVKPVPESGLGFSDYLSVFQRMQKESETSEDEGSGLDQLQMISLFGRWHIPGYGFELYGEWSRNTPANDGRDFLLEPEYSRAYMLGFLKKANLSPGRWLMVNFEMTHLESPRLAEFRDARPYYVASGVLQGYTHRGQILGAGTGPGSNSQRVAVHYFDSWGMAGISFNRVVHDIDRLYRNHEIIGARPRFTFNPRVINQVELRYGLHGLIFLPWHLEIQANLYRSKYFHYMHQWGEGEDAYNTRLEFTLRYSLPGFLR